MTRVLGYFGYMLQRFLAWATRNRIDLIVVCVSCAASSTQDKKDVPFASSACVARREIPLANMTSSPSLLVCLWFHF